MFTKPPRRVIGFVLFASMTLSACHGWRSQTAPSSGTQLPNPVRVTRMESVILLRDAVVARDSIIGRAYRPGGSERVAVPLSDVRRIEGRGMDGGRTALLGAGILAGVLGLAILAAASIPPSVSY